MIVLHLLLLAVSVCAVGAASVRWACSLAGRITPRLLGAVSLGAGIVVAEALLLGLFGVGTSAVSLTLAAIVTWLLSLVALPSPSPRLADQLIDRWTGAGLVSKASAGSVVVFVGGWLTYQLWNPTVGGDGLRYHAAEPVIWLNDGHVGSFHQTLTNIPTQAYPKTIEVLVSWVYSIGRTPVAAIPLTVGLSCLAALAVFAGLRRFGVHPAVAGLATAAGLLLPVNVQESTGVYSDVPALAWLAVAVTLCVTSSEDPGASGLGAVAAALAIGTKPSTLPLALVALGVAIWINREWILANLVRLLPIAGLALGLGTVWYVANWVKYGAPLWPFSVFPSGPRPPLVWREAGGAKFINDPVGVVRFLGLQPFVRVLGGGLVLLASVPLVAVAAFAPAARQLRRSLLVGVAVVVGSALLWADSEFTGVAKGAVPVVITGLRYLTPVPLAAAALLAIATRGGRLLAVGAKAVLIFALVVDCVQIHKEALNYAFRPGIGVCIVLVVMGATAAGLLAQRSDTQVAGGVAVLRVRGLSAVAVVAVGLLMAIPASHFLSRYLTVAQRHAFGDASILRYLSTQPGWVHGHAPVAAGGEAYSTLAGPRFTHPLSFIADKESCASIRAAARTGWVVLEPITGEAYPGLNYKHAPACMDGITPAAKLPGGVKIYAPTALQAMPHRPQ